jgi:hypothetical protein
VAARAVRQKKEKRRERVTESGMKRERRGTGEAERGMG